MHRIGIAASKIAKGNIALYNIFVIVLSFLLSLLIFFISAFSILISVLLIIQISNGIIGYDISDRWFALLRVCMGALAVVVGIVNIIAILRNIKIKL